MARNSRFSRRKFLRAASVAAGAAALAACATPTPQIIKETVVVKETVPVEKIVEKTVTVKETVVVEKVATQIVEKQVEKVVTPAPTKKKTVTVYAEPWFFAKNPYFYQLKVEYEATFPDREVVFSPENDYSKSLLESKLKTSHADIMMGNSAGSNMLPLVNGDVVTPITNLVPKEWYNYVPKSYVDACSYQGALYGWPDLGGVTLMDYRKSMLQDIGHPEPPATYEELIQVCKDVQGKLKARDGSMVYGCALDLYWWRAPLTVGLSMMGTDFYGKDGYLAWDDPRTEEVFNMLKTLVPYSPKEIYLPGDTSSEALGAGKAATVLGSDASYWAKQSFGINDLGLAPNPIFPGGEKNPRGYVGSGANFFFKYGNLENAWHFFSWIYEKEDYHRSLWELGGWLPITTRYKGASWVTPALQQQIDIGNLCVALPLTDAFWTLAPIARDGVSNWMLGKYKTAREAIDEIKMNFDAAVKQAG